MLHAIRAALVTATLVALCAPASAEAQIRRGRADDPAATGWAPASVGLRAGYDSNSRGEVLGAHAHVPFLRNGLLELAPSADITFLTGAKEYQYSLDLAWVSAGREGGLFLGGSLGYRDTVVTVDQSGQRSTLFSYGAVAGFRTGTAGPVQVLVELRWIFLEDSGTSDYRPVPITLGAAFPLWGRG